MNNNSSQSGNSDPNLNGSNNGQNVQTSVQGTPSDQNGSSRKPSSSNTKANFRKRRRRPPRKNNGNGRPNANSGNNIPDNSPRNKLPNRSKQESGCKNNYSLQCNNHSIEIASAQYFNQNVITQNFRDVVNKTLVLEYTIVPINVRLKAQANIWARKIFSTQEIILRYILGSNQNQWISKLEECFIYSYFKCLLYGITDRRVSEDQHNKFCVYGHVVMKYALSAPSHTFTHRNQTVKYSLRMNDEDLAYITKCLKKFSYLNKLYNTGIRFSFESEEYDRILNGLNDSFTEDEPKMADLFNNSNSMMTQLSKDNFPILNSLYAKGSNLDDWYYAFKETSSVLDMSTLFGKAIFCTSVDDKENGKYFSHITDDDDYYLTKYEVMCLCGCMFPDILGSFVKS